jgi:hypothetical protein
MDDHLDFGADEAFASNHDDLRFASPTEGSVQLRSAAACCSAADL